MELQNPQRGDTLRESGEGRKDVTTYRRSENQSRTDLNSESNRLPLYRRANRAREATRLAHTARQSQTK